MHSAQSEGDAAKACEAVGEQLWASEMKTFSIQSNIDYLTYEEKYSANQLYWIAHCVRASGDQRQRKFFNGQSQVVSPSAIYLNSTILKYVLPGL